MAKTKQSNWELPTAQPSIRGEELAAWIDTTQKVAELATAMGFSKARISREADIGEGTFSQWYGGTYNVATIHTMTVKMKRWLASHAEAMKVDKRILTGPDYIATPTSKKVMMALRFAHQASEFSIITLAAGMGKTVTCKHYQKLTPHVYRATMRPQTSTLHSMMVELCRVLDVAQNNPAKLDTAIGEKLKAKEAKCLLMIDEAQNLHDRAVDQLRYFLDEYNCGIALLGNEEVYKRFAGKTDGPSYGQINRRVGYRIRQMKPTRDDITAVLDAWKIKDDENRKLLAAIGMRDGALGQITKTIQLASMSAIGAGEEMNAGHIKDAWSIREGGNV